MTKKEIIQSLSAYPDDMEVKVYTQDPYDGMYECNMKDLGIDLIKEVSGVIRITLDY